MAKTQIISLVKKEANIQYINLSQELKLALADLSVLYPDTDMATKRAREKEAALHIINDNLNTLYSQVCYEASGRPCLPGGPEISISHSYNLLGVLFSDSNKPVGLDIEKVREKVIGIKHKFLSEEELDELKNQEALKYTLYWAAKEAVYKAARIEGLLFAGHIAVSPFELSGGLLNAQVNSPMLHRQYKLGYFLKNEYVIVYTLNS